MTFLKKYPLAIKILKYVITVSVFILLAIVLNNGLQKVDFTQINLNYFIFAAFFSNFINPIIINNRTKVFLEILDIKEKLFSLMSITYMSFFYGFLFPSSNGVDAVRILKIEKRHPFKRGMAAAAIITERVFGLVLLIVIAILSLFFVSYDVVNLVLFPLLIIIFTVGALMFLIFNRTLLWYIVYKLKRIRFIRKVLLLIIKINNGLQLLKNDKKVIRSFFWISLLQVSNITLVHILFTSFGLTIDFKLHFVFMPIIQVITLLPFSINGFGIREGAFVFFYNFIGVNPKISIIISLLYFLILVGIPTFIGGILVLVQKKYSHV
jgi:uncharacterized protein (TIRG00374 family)